MSVLLADSGSTKTDWALLTNQSVQIYKSEGLNPQYHTSVNIKNIIENELKPKIDYKSITQIIFYGAGCDSKNKTIEFKHLINNLFPHAQTEVNGDLLGAARACCLNKPGIVCILGTGSNSCLYNGVRVVKHIPSLGFILGDEGSAGFFGRKIINQYFRNELPHDLKHSLEKNYIMDLESIYEGVYNSNQTSRFVASYSTFIRQNLSHPFIQKMLYSGFENFIKRIVLQYKNTQKCNVNFVGFLGNAYKEILKNILSEYGMKTGIFIKSPLKRLIQYHRIFDKKSNL